MGQSGTLMRINTRGNTRECLFAHFVVPVAAQLLIAFHAVIVWMPRKVFRIWLLVTEIQVYFIAPVVGYADIWDAIDITIVLHVFSAFHKIEGTHSCEGIAVSHNPYVPSVIVIHVIADPL